MSQHNHVTLFAQGMGHVRKFFNVRANTEERISIPFNKDHMGDVLASLSVFGNVKFNAPPSFPPVNANGTSLKIETNSALTSLIRGLSGAKVKVHFNSFSDGSDSLEEANLLGMDVIMSHSGTDTAVETERLVIERNGVTLYYPLDCIVGVEFLEDSVKAEIEKARKANFQKIKPESTFLELSLSTLANKDEEAVVQYTIPIAAWKMRYNIRQDGAVSVLEACVIVDNNTDEDWDNTIVSVVTGNPISFTTDLATVTIPKRDHVNLVDSDAQPVVLAARQINEISRPRIAAGKALYARMSSTTSNRAEFGMEEAALESAFGMTAAEAPGMDSKDIGDFCVFTSKEPVTIASRRSAIVPMFSTPLTTSGAVLLYKEENHPRRPYRAFKFKNESDHTLGKGKVVFYRDDLFQGEAVLETAKPGENRILPHCLENGVRVVKSEAKISHMQSSIRFSRGTAYEETISKACVEYEIENKKDEEFKLLIDHELELSEASVAPSFEGMTVDQVEKIGDGYRAYLTLAPKQSGKILVSEVQISQQSVSIEHNFNWVFQKVVNPKHALNEDAHIKKCVELNMEMRKVDEKVAELDQRKKEISTQADRVRANYSATKDDGVGGIRSEWLKDLDTTEKEIRQIETVTRPKLITERKDFEKQLAHELKQLTASWTIHSNLLK